MKAFFWRLQKTFLFISMAIVGISLVYSATRFYEAQKNIASVRAELDATEIQIAEYKAGIGKDLPPSKMGKPPFDPSKYLYDHELIYGACLASAIKGNWASEGCNKALNTERHTGPWVTYAIAGIRNASSDAQSGLCFAGLGILLATLSLFLSWLITGRIRT